jgi:hypothetical protein
MDGLRPKHWLRLPLVSPLGLTTSYFCSGSSKFKCGGAVFATKNARSAIKGYNPGGATRRRAIRL